MVKNDPEILHLTRTCDSNGTLAFFLDISSLPFCSTVVQGGFLSHAAEWESLSRINVICQTNLASCQESGSWCSKSAFEM